MTFHLALTSASNCLISLILYGKETGGSLTVLLLIHAYSFLKTNQTSLMAQCNKDRHLTICLGLDNPSKPLVRSMNNHDSTFPYIHTHLVQMTTTIL